MNLVYNSIGLLILVPLFKHFDPKNNIQADLTKKKFSKYGVIRLQTMPAYEAAKRSGLNPRIVGLNAKSPGDLDLIAIPKICLVSKLITSETEQDNVIMANLACLMRLKRRNVPIIVSYTDNWCLSNDRKGEFYRDLMSLADIVVYPSNGIREHGSKWISPTAKSFIIEDPWQINRQEFSHFNSNEICKLIWFGHRKNLSFLCNLLPKLLAGCSIAKQYELTIISDFESCQIVEQIVDQNPHLKPWTVRKCDWDIQHLEPELARSHIAIIPSNPSSPMKSNASHNRAVDALQGGCMVIASPLKSYLELKKCILIAETDDDFILCMNSGLHQYSRLTTKWQGSRDKLLSRFDPELNLRKWEDLYNQAFKLNS